MGLSPPPDRLLLPAEVAAPEDAGPPWLSPEATRLPLEDATPPADVEELGESPVDRAVQETPPSTTSREHSKSFTCRWCMRASLRVGASTH